MCLHVTWNGDWGLRKFVAVWVVLWGRFEPTYGSTVKASLESAKLRLYDALSTRMAHWSIDRHQYEPCVLASAQSLSSLRSGIGKRLLLKGGGEVVYIGFTCAARRGNRPRRIQVPAGGRMKIRICRRRRKSRTERPERMSAKASAVGGRALRG